MWFFNAFVKYRTRFSRLFLLLLTILGLLVAVPLLDAATIAVPSMSQSNMLWCASHAHDGDEFIFPPGVADYFSISPRGSFVNYCVLWTNAVTLRFSPGKSIIRNQSRDPYSFVFSMESTARDKPIQIRGLTVDGRKSASGVVIWGNQRNVRVTGCVFLDCVHSGLKWWGWEAYGLTDHCSFTNCEQAIVVYGDDNTSWDTTEGPSYGLGTTNGVYVEDCNVVYDTNSGWLGTSPLPIENGHGARAAYRHNTFLSSSPNNLEFFDSHGNQLLWPGDHRATIWTVLENNTFSILNTYLYVYVRGGTLIMISNVLSGYNTVGISLTEEEGWRQDLFNPLRTAWPAQDQITNSWFVRNYINGALITAFDITNGLRSPIGSVTYGYPENWSDLTFIHEGRDFFVSTNPPPPFGFQNPGISGGAFGYTALPYPHPMIASARKPVSAALAPVARAARSSGPAPLTVSFSSLGSIASSGVKLSCFWNFGDGETSTDPNPSHTYHNAGTFTAKLLISNGGSTTSAPPITITVSP